jgi:hypothetical protein
MDLCHTHRSAIRRIIETWDPLSGAMRHQPVEASVKPSASGQTYTVTIVYEKRP